MGNKVVSEVFVNKIKLLSGNDLNIADDVILMHIEMAKDTINSISGFKETEETDLMPTLNTLCLQLALSSLNKIGAEGQLSHNENGVSRSYGNDGFYPQELLNRIPSRVMIGKMVK